MMKRTILATLLLLLCLCSASAQSKTASTDAKAFDKFFVESSAQYWTGVVLDYRSSLNTHEGNPLFQNRQGEISGAKFFAINTAIYTLTVGLQKKYPKLINWTRRIHAWVHIGVAGHNYTIPTRR
jgi:hypothetical protein